MTGEVRVELPATQPLSDRESMQAGDRLFRQERWQEAATHYERAIALQPTAVPWRCKLGKTWLRQANWDKAEQQFLSALALNERSHLASYGLAEVAMGRQDWGIATDRLRQVIALNPGFVARVYLDLGRVLQQLQRWEEAIAAVCAALTRSELDEGYEQLSSMLCERARYASGSFSNLASNQASGQ